MNAALFPPLFQPPLSGLEESERGEEAPQITKREEFL